MAELRVVLIVDDGRGQSALVFKDQEAAQAWLDHAGPEVEDTAQGIVPIVSRRSVLREVKRSRTNPDERPGPTCEGS